MNQCQFRKPPVAFLRFCSKKEAPLYRRKSERYNKTAPGLNTVLPLDVCVT